MATSNYTVLKRPLVTEKSSYFREEDNAYTFEVRPDANKIEIRQAVESLFGVRVLGVRTAVVRGKIKRVKRRLGKKPNWKKAVVTLHEDDHIELFEGV